MVFHAIPPQWFAELSCSNWIDALKVFSSMRWFLHLPCNTEEILMWETLCNWPAKEESSKRSRSWSWSKSRWSRIKKGKAEREAAATKLQDAAAARQGLQSTADRTKTRSGPSEQSDRQLEAVIECKRGRARDWNEDRERTVHWRKEKPKAKKA